MSTEGVKILALEGALFTLEPIFYGQNQLGCIDILTPLPVLKLMRNELPKTMSRTVQSSKEDDLRHALSIPGK